jgi:hypothetical protein
VPRIYDEIPFSQLTAPWLLTETLSFLLHLEVTGRARRWPISERPGEAQRWGVA